MKDLNELAVFMQVAQQTSFTRAADALEISKAAASKAITSLEARLGTRLFERTTRKLRLTEAGEVYLAYARRALDEAEEGEAAVSKLSASPRGTLRVAMPVTLAQSSLAPKLAGFLRLYPELRLDITLRGGQIDPIANRVDVAFQTARPDLDSQLIQRRMVTVRTGIFAAPQYLVSAPPLQKPQDLADHSCLTHTGSQEGTTWHLTRDGESQEVRLRGRVAIGDPLIHHRLCVDGVGVAILPNWLLNHNPEEERLVRVLPEWTPPAIELYVLYPTRLSMTPKLNVFLRFIEAIVPES